MFSCFTLESKNRKFTSLARLTNEAHLAFYFVKTMPPPTDNEMFSLTAIYLHLDWRVFRLCVCVFVHMGMFTPANLAKRMSHTR